MKVNGETVTELGYKAGFDDDITVDGKSLKQENKVVYLLNKPKNVISSASDDKGRTTVVDLIDSEYRVYPLGRLDFDSSGLILLSNDGELMQKLIHPRFHIEKVYEVTVNGNIGSEEIKKLENGVTIEGQKTLPCTIKLVSVNPNKDTSRLLVTIREGRNRQIRKMFDSLHCKVTRLHRIREANIELGNLKSGEYRQLKPYEIKKLKQYLDRDDVQ